jgi:hypothetical protein
MAEYWLKENDAAEPLGPYSGTLVKRFVAEDRIDQDWLISSDQRSWTRAGSVKALFAATPPPVPGKLSKDPANGPAIAALLLSGSAPFSVDALKSQLEKNPAPGQTRISTDRGMLTFNQNDAIVAIAPMPAPYPWNDLKGPCATSWMWPSGTNAMSVKDHRLHVLVTVVGGKVAPIDRRLLLTRLAVIGAQQPGVMAVFWCEGTLVHHPKVFTEMGRKIVSPLAPPLYLWVDYRVERNTDGTIRLFTTGLDALGMMEIEIPSIGMPPAQLRDWAVNITYYLIEKGPVLKHGNTIGIDAAHQMRIRHAPSMYTRRTDAPVLRIESQ